MKEFIFTVLATFFLCSLQGVAQGVDLTTVKGGDIYSAQVGGVPVDGVLERVEITLPEYKSAVLFASPMASFDAINQLQSWYSTDISTLFTKSHNLEGLHVIKFPQNQIFFMALELESGEYMTIQPISALEVTSWIEIKDRNTISVVCGTMGVDRVEQAEVALFAYTKGDDLYGALSKMWGDILCDSQVEGRTTWRDEKSYPEMFRYLGWCSWEQYRKNIYESLLIEAVDHIENSELPIRWILVDDGHQTRAESGALMNFEISQSRFPNGWEPILAKRSDKVKWFGLWHCMFGEWKGISVEHTMDDLADYLIPHTANSLIVDESQKSSDLLFEKMINSVAQPGFDFTKVDVQSRDFKNYIGKGNPVVAHRYNAESLEAQTNANLGGLINCMAQNLPCVFNTRYSAVTRVSVDYKLNNIPLAIAHIYQSYQNSAWMGQTVWPDHDMFHSSDEALGQFMAVSKAMSGAPIYLSDAPKDMLSELVMPLVYEDGELLRPMAPGVPLPDSFFADALLGSDIYRVIAPLSPKAAAIVAYNISSDYPNGMEGVVSAEDYKYADAMVQPYSGLRSIPSEGLVYYDWYEKCGGVLVEDYQFVLPSVCDKLIILSEIEQGWSVIGLEDKYLSAVAVESVKTSKNSIDITMHEQGTILVYSDKAIKRASSGEVEAVGNGIYRIVGADSSVTLYR